MADWTLDLGKIGFTFLGAYDSSMDYPAMTIVKHAGKVWGTEVEVISGESPGLTGKWKLWIDSDTVTYPTNSILGSNDSGELDVIPNAEGMLTYNPITGFQYLPLPDVSTDSGTKIDLLPSSNYQNYGLSFLTNKGDIKVAGYYSSSTIHNSHGTNGVQFNALAFEEPYTGTIVQMIVTYYNRYALTSTGEVWSMGTNDVGQTGHPRTDGTRIYMMRKLPVANVVSMAVSGGVAGTSYASFMVCDSDGKLHGAGYNGYGVLGMGNNTTINTGITEVPGISNAISVWGGIESRYGAFAYLSNEATNNLYVAGYNGYGTLGIGNTTTKNVFTKSITETGDPVPKVIKVLLSGHYSSHTGLTALTDSGRIYTTGSGSYSNGGWGSTSNKTKLQKMTYEGYIDMAVIDTYAGAKFLLRGDKKVDFMGYNGYSVSGEPTMGSTGPNVPTTLTGPHVVDVVKIITNTTYNKQVAYFLNEDGEVYHTGDRANGKTGGVNRPSKEPTKLPIREPIVDMHLGGSSSNVCVILRTATGKGYVLGYNGHGELGMGYTNTYITAPSQVNL